MNEEYIIEVRDDTRFLSFGLWNEQEYVFSMIGLNFIENPNHWGVAFSDLAGKWLVFTAELDEEWIKEKFMFEGIETLLEIRRIDGMYHVRISR